MRDIIKKDILKIINQVLELLKQKDETNVVELKELSDHVIHNASIFQDKDSVSIAVLIYSLSKIIEREGFIEKKIVQNLKHAKFHLEKDEFTKYNIVIKKTFRAISRADNKLKLYIQEVIDQAEIKKGSRLYEHGISIAQAASVLGISQWDLMSYIGKTKIPDVTPLRSDVKNRLMFTRKLFGLK